MPPQEIGGKERQLFECITGMGQKTLDMIPAVWRLMLEAEPGASWKAAESERATLRCGGTLIHVGVPALDLTHFENSKVRQLMLVPHRTARGPNGMWLIRRGTKHPHMLGLKRCCVFYVGMPGIETAARPQQERGDASVIEVFDLKADATEALKKLKLNSANSSQVIQAKGFALYELIIRAGAVRYGDDLISLTSNGLSASVKA